MTTPEGDIYFSLPEYCEDHDEPTWHIQHIWSYSDGTFSECDADGNHEPLDPEDVPSIEEHDRLWRDYAQWVVENGKDPLGNYYVKHTRKIRQRWQFRFGNSILGPLLTEARLAGKRYWWNEVPEHVRQYLNLAPVTFNRGKLGDFATWEALVEAQPEIKPGRWWSVQIDHDQPRSPAIVERELRRMAKAHLRQTKSVNSPV